MQSLLGVSRDRLLGAVGLQTRRSPAVYLLPALGALGVGLVAGAALGVLFAPRSGRESRRELVTRVTDVTDKLGRKIRRTTDEAAGLLAEAGESLHGFSEYTAAGSRTDSRGPNGSG